MPFTFNIDKPKDLSYTLARLKKGIEQENGSVTGDTKTGTINAGGVEAKYVVNEQHIEITITKKPVIFPNPAIEMYIRKMFKG